MPTENTTNTENDDDDEYVTTIDDDYRLTVNDGMTTMITIDLDQDPNQLGRRRMSLCIVGRTPRRTTHTSRCVVFSILTET